MPLDNSYLNSTSISLGCGIVLQVPKGKRNRSVKIAIRPEIPYVSRARAFDLALGALRRAVGYEGTTDCNDLWSRSGKWQEVVVPIAKDGLKKLFDLLEPEIRKGDLRIRVNELLVDRAFMREETDRSAS